MPYWIYLLFKLSCVSTEYMPYSVKMKARIKSFEDMPEWAKCCVDTCVAMKPYCEVEITLVLPRLEKVFVCPFCGAENRKPYFHVVGFPGVGMATDTVDIDEGG